MVSSSIKWVLALAVVACAVVTDGTPSVRAAARKTQSTHTLETILARSARYVADYQRLFSSVVAEERYEQRLQSKSSGGSSHFGRNSGWNARNRRRRLMSDYLLVKAPGQSGWVPFRDVYEVDGKAVRDRDERVMELFVNSPAIAWDQAIRVAEESSRFNLGSVRRTINVPTLALIFLTSEQQPRFEFRHEDTLQTPEGETWVVSYREHGRPTLIRGQGGADVPALGRFWIDAEDGRVLRSLLRANDGDVRSEIKVTYQPDDKLGLWVPSEMKEQYHTGHGETIHGTASYGRFRQFNVATSEKVR